MSRPSFVIDFTSLANEDVRETLLWSEGTFGPLAAKRYGALIVQALDDLVEDPGRAGVRGSRLIPKNISLYPLAASRERVAGARVRTPRHVIAFRVMGHRVMVLRILHESQDLAQHLGGVE